jgi:predicted NUDIX family NTP pyrophosphohydrolase
MVTSLVLEVRSSPSSMNSVAGTGEPISSANSRRDAGGWSIPKGESLPGEELVDVARREFAEEMGSPSARRSPAGTGELRTSSSKLVTIWALQGDLDAATTTSNTFSVEWPPRSGRVQEFPEIDRSAWLPVEQAREKLVKGQAPFLDRLLTALAAHPGS